MPIVVGEGVFHDQRLSVLILAREEQRLCLCSNVVQDTETLVLRASCGAVFT